MVSDSERDRARRRDLAPAATKDFVLGNGGTKAPPYKGYGLCPTPCNTNTKPAIKTEKEKLVISSSLLLEIINGNLLNE